MDEVWMKMFFSQWFLVNKQNSQMFFITHFRPPLEEYPSHLSGVRGKGGTGELGQCNFIALNPNRFYTTNQATVQTPLWSISPITIYTHVVVYASGSTYSLEFSLPISLSSRGSSMSTRCSCGWWRRDRICSWVSSGVRGSIHNDSILILQIAIWQLLALTGINLKTMANFHS